jgi:hypothetical protein
MIPIVKEFYSIGFDQIPKTRERSQWKTENKCGFLLGIIEYGLWVGVS